MVMIIRSVLLFLFCFTAAEVSAQYNHDITGEIEIPGLADVESSETHLYLLSESEGLVVYRAYQDSLQWLYTSSGMQQRGNRLQADIRFAYLYGTGRRLTVIEPTSVLGVYSSTVLPNAPVTTRRIGNRLYIVLDDGSLQYVSLESPESVDSAPEPADPDTFEGRTVNDLATDANRFLYVLSDYQRIDIYRYSSSEEQLISEETVELDREFRKIFYAGEELYGATRNGEVYRISSDGQTDRIFDAEEPVQKLSFWNEEIVVRTENGQLWIGNPGDELIRWKENGDAGNYFTVNKNRLYVSESNSLFPVLKSNEEDSSADDTQTRGEDFSIKQIETVTIPFPKPLIIPIEIEGYSGNPAQLTYSVDSRLNNVKVRGNTIFWQPGASNTGRHQMSVTATTPEGKSTQTTFTVDVKPFNSPPRFSPTRSQSIPSEEPYELSISAFDPDGTHPDLIRYLGVDLPSGASLDEQTGEFTWEPTIRQVGEHQFRVIATDQFGAAASQNFQIRVVEVQEGEDPEDAETQENNNTNDS